MYIKKKLTQIDRNTKITIVAVCAIGFFLLTIFATISYIDLLFGSLTKSICLENKKFSIQDCKKNFFIILLSLFFVPLFSFFFIKKHWIATILFSSLFLGFVVGANIFYMLASQ